MRSVARRSRLLAAFALASAVAAGGLLAERTTQIAGLRAHAAAGLVTAPDLPRDPWFHLRLLDQGPRFQSRTPPAGAPEIHALGGILVDLDAGTILWQQDAHRRLPPASTAKIMTALVALENFSLSRRVTITATALDQAWDESTMGLAAGQVLTVEELLSGMMMVSGNDAASALAVDTVGRERFLAAMNAQATALGLHDSHFTNPTGLQDAEEYSSAYDLAVLGVAAIERHPELAAIVASQDLILPASPGHPEYDLSSVNLLLSRYPFAVGIKPGWTGDAGYCLVAMAARGGHRLVSVLLNAPYSVSQSRRLLDWGFVRDGLPSTLPTPSASPSPRG